MFNHHNTETSYQPRVLTDRHAAHQYNMCLQTYFNFINHFTTTETRFFTLILKMFQLLWMSFTVLLIISLIITVNQQVRDISAE